MSACSRSPVALVAAACLHPVAAAGAETVTPVVGAGSVLQVLLGLAIVLGMVFAAAWAIRRFNPNAASGGGLVRVVGATAVGNRERVLVVEVADTWLVVGVAPGRVSPLHSLPRPARAPDAEPVGPSGTGFATWLRKTIEERTANRGNGR